MVRIKHRYILFDILYPPHQEPDVTLREAHNEFSESQSNALLYLHQASPPTITYKEIIQAIKNSLEDHFGDAGAGKAGFLVLKYFSNKTSTGILRCHRDQSDVLVAAMSLIKKISKCSVIVRCLHISGTIKKCEEYSIEKTKELINVIKNTSKGKVDDYMVEIDEMTQLKDDADESNEEEDEED